MVTRMARKITLSIPDMLHEKMEEWRRSFNLSKMFQDALSEAIQKKEEFQRRLQEDATMSEIIERLKQEKKMSEGNYVNRGKNDGVAWAKTAHYDDLMHAVELDTSSKLAMDVRMAPHVCRKIATDPVMDITPEGLNKYARLYVDGWRKGIYEFWNAIKEKI